MVAVYQSCHLPLIIVSEDQIENDRQIEIRNMWDVGEKHLIFGGMDQFVGNPVAYRIKITQFLADILRKSWICLIHHQDLIGNNGERHPFLRFIIVGVQIDSR